MGPFFVWIGEVFQYIFSVYFQIYDVGLPNNSYLYASDWKKTLKILHTAHWMTCQFFVIVLPHIG